MRILFARGKLLTTATREELIALFTQAQYLLYLFQDFSRTKIGFGLKRVVFPLIFGQSLT